jgi:hypothetical protein
VLLPEEEEDAEQTQPLNEEPALTGTQPLDDTGPKSGPLYTQQAPASDTRPLPRVRNFFEPLPERAILNEGRCLIRSLHEESPLLNVYSAVSRRALVDCRQCGFTRNNFGDQYCLQCGASLRIEPNYPNFVKETLAPDAIAIERQLAEMELHHGGRCCPLRPSPRSLGTRRLRGPARTRPLPAKSAVAAGTERCDQLGRAAADALAFLLEQHLFGAAH